MTRRRRAGIFVLLALAVVAMLVATVPWRALIQQKLVEALQEKGFEDVQIEVGELGFNTVTLRSISLGGKIPLTLQTLKLDYSLWQGRVEYVTLEGISVTAGDVVAQGNIIFKITPDSKAWKGTWRSTRIFIHGLPVTVPETQANGTWALTPEAFIIEGEWASAGNAYRAEFMTQYVLATPHAPALKIASFAMPWGGGTVALKDAVIPFTPKAYTLAVMLKAVTVDALLQPLTGNRATATGTVSGTLPVTIEVDGSLIPKTGSLKATAPGRIVMQPEAIPGDNAQIDMLREVMKDFHYSALALSVENDAKNKLSVGLMLEGNNPTAYDGRPVKLNVHLSGDVLDFVSQSMAVNDPHKLLKDAGTHAK